MVPKPRRHFCGICGQSCATKDSLRQHESTHAEMQNVWTCEICHWSFPDELALETHQLHSDHKPRAKLTFACGRCAENPSFATEEQLVAHQKFPSFCADAYTGYRTQTPVLDYGSPILENVKPRVEGKLTENAFVEAESPKGADISKGSDISKGAGTSKSSYIAKGAGISKGTDIFKGIVTSKGIDTSKGSDRKCEGCKKSFSSEASYTRHFLACNFQQNRGGEVKSINKHTSSHVPDSPLVQALSRTSLRDHNYHKIGATTANPVEKNLVVKPDQQKEQLVTPDIKNQSQSVGAEQSRQPPAIQLINELVRGIPQGNEPRNADLVSPQNAGGKSAVEVANEGRHEQNDIFEKADIKQDVSQSQHAAEYGPRAKTSTVKVLDMPPAVQKILLMNDPSLAEGDPLLEASKSPHRSKRIAVKQRPELARYVPGPRMQGQDSIHQPLEDHTEDHTEDARLAETLSKQIMRLALQSDINIMHEGKIECNGENWIRIPVSKYGDAIEMLDGLCHLPRELQKEHYLPVPKTFSKNYTASYLVTDFEPSPEVGKHGTALKAIALSSSKIELPNKCLEAIKIGAVDVLSGRVILNHLICIDPISQVSDWNAKITGFASYEDLEYARMNGYKVFKGWEAVRSALFRFINKETIVVGHNLRSDLDAVRLIHGRGVDIVKVIEKAAKGPVSEPQLSLDSLCRDILKKTLNTNPYFGRDCLQDAFAARELLLWNLKNNEKLVQWAKARSEEFCRLRLDIRS